MGEAVAVVSAVLAAMPEDRLLRMRLQLDSPEKRRMMSFAQQLTPWEREQVRQFLDDVFEAALKDKKTGEGEDADRPDDDGAGEDSERLEDDLVAKS